MPKKGYEQTTEHTEKRISPQRGIQKWNGKLPEKTKKKISETHKKRGVGKWMLGRKPSKEIRKKISVALKGRFVREKASRWQGGKSFEPYTVDWTETLRRSIRERDHYTCQISGVYGNVVHHIDYNKKNCDPKNLITLSRKWNSKVNFNRKYWIKYFKVNRAFINI